MEEEEYELIPVSPLRKMEKRMDRLEKGGTSSEMIKELIEVVRTNQRIVDEVVKINSEMINRVSELSTGVTKLAEKMNTFLDRVEITEVKGGGTEEGVSAGQTAVSSDVEQRIQKLEKRINSMLVSAMKAKQMRAAPPVRRPQYGP